jgi:prepilin-type N-terminal cleavage/methylation domain-containing protein
MKPVHSNKRGFTLLELLTVLAVIGLLATIVLASLNDSRARGRDATRVKELKELQKAIELYRADNTGFPPRNTARSGSTVATEVCADGTRGAGGASGSWCLLLADIAPYYKGGLKDPRGDSQTTYRFYYDADSGDNYQTYGLMALLESSSNDKIVNNDGGVYCMQGGVCNSSTVRGFEIGPQPAICQAQGETNWWSNGNAVCP